MTSAVRTAEATPDATEGETFGQLLRRLRKEKITEHTGVRRKGVGQRELARAIHFTPARLSQVENGDVPTLELAQACDDYLGAGGRLVALAEAMRAPKLWPTPAQLPVAASLGLVGRERDLATLQAVAGTPRGAVTVVAIDGPPGAGKTALALTLAQQIMGRHAGGVLYRDLQGFGPAMESAAPGVVLSGFLLALGVSASRIPSDVDERAALFRSIARERPLLVVLDNARSARQVDLLLPNSPGCTVVITSRRRLSGLVRTSGAVLLTVGPLPAAASVQLLGTLAGAGRVEAEPEAALALADVCGHLPLALCIAGERAQRRPHHSLAELVDELAERERVLDVLAEDVGEQPGVRTVLSWSYRALAPDLARGFRLLSLSPGAGFTTPAAAALLGASERSARRILDGLAGVHLVEETSRDRWRFHDLLAIYARDKARHEDSAAERTAAVRRLVQWYVHSALSAEHTIAPHRTLNLALAQADPGVYPVEFGGDADLAVQWCDGEASNFVPIARLAVEHGLDSWAWQLPVVLWSWLLLRSPHDIWIQTHEIGLQGAVRLGDDVGKAWVLANLAWSLRLLRRFDEAEHACEESLRLRAELGDRHGQAWSLTGLGVLALDRRHLGAAQLHLEQALPLFDATEDAEVPHGRSVALTALGAALAMSLQINEARRCWDAALEGFTQIGDAYGQALTLFRRGEMELRLGHLGDAFRILTESMDQRRGIGDRAGEAECLTLLARVYFESNHPEDAQRLREQAVRIYDEMGDPRADEVRNVIASIKAKQHNAVRLSAVAPGSPLS